MSPRINLENKYLKQIISRNKKDRLKEIDSIDMGSIKVLKHINEVNDKNLENFNRWLPKTTEKYKN